MLREVLLLIVLVLHIVLAGESCSNPVGCSVDKCIKVGAVNHCLSCVEGYFFNTGDTCLPCPEGCKSCRTYTICEVCHSGYAFNPQGMCIPTHPNNQTKQGKGEAQYLQTLSNTNTTTSSETQSGNSGLKTFFTILISIIGGLLSVILAFYCAKLTKMNKSTNIVKPATQTAPEVVQTEKAQPPLSTERALKQPDTKLPEKADKEGVVHESRPIHKRLINERYYRKARQAMLQAQVELHDLVRTTEPPVDTAQ